ncbi:DUF3017 domain-containing protein [Catenulispora sp. NF23]|uniref:DUF3017 domain-containing protein n=1 Tax=Catenulispora pinistramenti TaxID=2705254 RepID=A0ABS5KI69_9ACTN|nr:DUF3017 domain-containing protein [Catenulispora pinistramenti]MBS2539347.1 DUF3017 domain-containing protein [Catenulispora pinistramenti]MBS2545752.1 DUF3017 domain-containing protein [Catenulispora pinistramenti]
MAVNNRPPGTSFGRQVAAEWPILAVLAGFGFGMTVILHNEVFQGAAVMGLSLLMGAGLRLFLPTRVAGTLAVRRRAVDVGMYTVVGLTLVVLGLLVQGIFSN